MEKEWDWSRFGFDATLSAFLQGLHDAESADDIRVVGDAVSREPDLPPGFIDLYHNLRKRRLAVFGEEFIGL